jgi:hypothetical protein
MLAGKQWLSFEGSYCRYVQLQGVPEDEISNLSWLPMEGTLYYTISRYWFILYICM